MSCGTCLRMVCGCVVPPRCDEAVAHGTIECELAAGHAGRHRGGGYVWDESSFESDSAELPEGWSVDRSDGALLTQYRHTSGAVIRQTALGRWKWWRAGGGVCITEREKFDRDSAMRAALGESDAQREANELLAHAKRDGSATSKDGRINVATRLGLADNVVPFTGVTTGKVTASKVVDGAQEAALDEVVIVGRNADGELYFASSEPTPETLLLLELARAKLVAMAGGES